MKHYERHYTLKVNRLAVLRQAKYVCELCKDRATQTHHRDRSDDNHTQANLMPICAGCHKRFHPHRPGSVDWTKLGFHPLRLTRMQHLVPFATTLFSRKSKPHKYPRNRKRKQKPCNHPPARLYSWFAADKTLCVACCECGAVLRGATTTKKEVHCDKGTQRTCLPEV